MTFFGLSFDDWVMVLGAFSFVLGLAMPTKRKKVKSKDDSSSLSGYGND